MGLLVMFPTESDSRIPVGLEEVRFRTGNLQTRYTPAFWK